MIEQGISQLLSADAAMAALVNSCIYPVLVPENSSFPCLSYLVASSSTEVALDGAQETWKRFQFDAWGLSYSDVKAIQAELHNLFDEFTGLLPDGTTILGAFRGVETDGFEQNSRTYRALTEYLFLYVEP